MRDLPSPRGGAFTLSWAFIWVVALTFAATLGFGCALFSSSSHDPCFYPYADSFLEVTLQAQVGSLLAGIVTLIVARLVGRPVILFPVFVQAPVAWVLFRLGFVFAWCCCFEHTDIFRDSAPWLFYLVIGVSLVAAFGAWLAGGLVDRRWLERGPAANFLSAHVASVRLAALGAIDLMIAAGLATCQHGRYSIRWSPAIEHFFQHGMDVLPSPLLWLAYSMLGAILFGAIGWPLDLLRQRYRVFSASP